MNGAQDRVVMTGHRVRRVLAAAVMLLAAVAGVRWAAPDLHWADLWRTPDQQGRAAYARGDFALAAQRFADLRWRAAACYRARDAACAVDAWSRFDDADAEYNLGNTTLREGQLDTALAHYERALRLRPGWPEAIDNRDLTRRLIDAALAKEREKARHRLGERSDDEGGPDQRTDDKSGKGKPGQVMVEKLGPGDIDAIWLRNIRTDPAAFLRRRFAAELDGANANNAAGAAPGAPRTAASAAAKAATP
jgi:Ca-activated chloride channel family protein